MAAQDRIDHRADGGSARRRRLPAAERRETILRAAAEVFGQSGYRAAKVSDVAALVGVTEPVIFQNFGSKAALFAAVVERAARDVRESLTAEAEHGPASALLTHVLTGHARGRPDRALGEPGGWSGHGHHAGTAYGVLFADAAALIAEPELTEPAIAAIRAIAAHLTDLIQRAQADGTASADADPEAVAWLILSVLSAGPLRAAAMPADLEPAISALTLRALAPRPQESPSPGQR